MKNVHSRMSQIWRGAALGALLLGPAFLALASHESIGISGGTVPQFGLSFGVVSTAGAYWPLSWIAGFALGAVGGGLLAAVTSILPGKRAATVGSLSIGLLAGAALGVALGTLSQDILVTVTAGSEPLAASHHDRMLQGRHSPSAVTLASTAASGEGERIMMKGTFSRRHHWGMFAFSIPVGVLLGALTARGLGRFPDGDAE